MSMYGIENIKMFKSNLCRLTSLSWSLSAEIGWNIYKINLTTLILKCSYHNGSKSLCPTFIQTQPLFEYWFRTITNIFIISTWLVFQTGIYSSSYFFLNTKFQVFSGVLVLNSRFFQVFLCQIPGTFIQILVIKSIVTQNSMYFPGYFLVKAMKSSTCHLWAIMVISYKDSRVARK